MKQIVTIKRLAFAAIVVAYILIVFGGYVASSESGMGCGPEWPLCNGEVIPVMKGETLIEFAHRVIGLLLFVLSVGLFAVIRKEKSNDSISKTANWMIGLLIVQVLAGAVVVVLDLPSIVVTIHLIVAMIFMFTLIHIYRSANEKGTSLSINPIQQKKAIKSFNILLILLVLTLGLGAYIKHETYGLACSWLDCRDTILPTTGPELLQTLHRLFAVLTALYTLFLTLRAFFKKWDSHIQNRILLAAFTVLLQVASGILAVMTNIDVPWAVLHLAIGTALFMILADTRVMIGLANSASLDKWTIQSVQRISQK